MLHVSMDRLCTCEGLHCLPTDTVDSMLTFFAWRRQPRNVRSERHCRPHPHLAGGKEVQARGIVGIPPIRRRMSLHAPFRFFLSCPSCFLVFVSRPAGAEAAAVGAEMGRMLGAASALCTGYDAIRLEVGIRTQKGLSETFQTAPFASVFRLRGELRHTRYIARSPHRASSPFRPPRLQPPRRRAGIRKPENRTDKREKNGKEHADSYASG